MQGSSRLLNSSLNIVRRLKLLHGEEEDVFADSGYRGIEKRPEHQGRKVNWYIVMMPGKRKQLDKESPQELLEQAKARASKTTKYSWSVFGPKYAAKISH